MFRLRKLNIALEKRGEKTRQISAFTENSVKNSYLFTFKTRWHLRDNSIIICRGCGGVFSHVNKALPASVLIYLL